jgi:hypothetical protein
MNHMSKNSKISALMILLLGTTSIAKDTTTFVQPAIDKVACAKQVFHTLDGWEAPVSWRNLLSAERGVFGMTSPTKKIGTWISLVGEKNTTKLSRDTESTSVTFTFQEPSCMPQFQQATRLPASIRKDLPKAFGNSELTKLLTQKPQPGFIYVWSPQMNFSVVGAKEALKVGKDLGMNVTLVLDPHADAALAEKTRAKYGLPKSALQPIASTELMQRGLLIHYPALMVYRDGELVEPIHAGYSPPDLLKAALQKRSAK